MSLRGLAGLAQRIGRWITALVRAALRCARRERPLQGPVALSNGQLRGTSGEHNATFDDL